MITPQSIVTAYDEGRLTRAEMLTAIAQLIRAENAASIILSLPGEIRQDIMEWATNKPSHGGIVVGSNLSRTQSVAIAARVNEGAQAIRGWMSQAVTAKRKSPDKSQSSYQVEWETHELKGKRITWVGECPWTGLPCFGTDTGELFFDAEMPRHFRSPLDGPINGIAFSHSLFGLSSPDRAVVLRHTSFEEDAMQVGPALLGPCNGIGASPTGLFFVANGEHGLALIDSTRGNDANWSLISPAEASPNFYRATYLGEEGERDVIACALRTKGVAFFPRGPKQEYEQIRGFQQPTWDVVDVCGLRNDEWPLGAAGILRNGEILLCRNPFFDEPNSLRIPDMAGEANAILAALGHLFVLTSQSLVTLPFLARKFLNSESFAEPIAWYESHFVASAMGFIGHRQLAIIVDGLAISADVDHLARPERSLQNQETVQATKPRPLSSNTHPLIPTPPVRHERSLVLT